METHQLASENCKRAVPPAALAPWLYYRGSLTRQLQKALTTPIEVIVCNEGWSLPYAFEKKALDLQEDTKVWVREVQLSCLKCVYVFARTLVPASTLTGVGYDLSALGNTSLGEVLFTQSNAKRANMKVNTLAPSHAYFNKATAHLDAQAKMSMPSLWARSSLFNLENKPLLVNECFLPALTNLSFGELVHDDH